MVGLTVRPAEYDPREFSEKSNTRKNMRLDLLIGWDTLHDPRDDKLSTHKEIYRNGEYKQYAEDNNKIEQESTSTRKEWTENNQTRNSRAYDPPTDDERMRIFSRYIDTEEGDHTRDDSDFIILIFDRDGARSSLEYVTDTELTLILRTVPVIRPIRSLEQKEYRPSWDEWEDDRMYLYPEDRKIEKNTYYENIYPIDSCSNSHNDTCLDRMRTDEWVS